MILATGVEKHVLWVDSVDTDRKSFSPKRAKLDAFRMSNHESLGHTDFIRTCFIPDNALVRSNSGYLFQFLKMLIPQVAF